MFYATLIDKTFGDDGESASATPDGTKGSALDNRHSQIENRKSICPRSSTDRTEVSGKAPLRMIANTKLPDRTGRTNAGQKCDLP